MTSRYAREPSAHSAMRMRIRSMLSAFMLTVILVGALMVAFKIRAVKACGTICIRADVSIEGLSVNMATSDKITCTFTGDTYEPIVVERNNIVIDGAGYTLQGTGVSWTRGLNLTARTNVTVKNTQIENFDYDIRLYGSSSNNISGNDITANNVHSVGVAYSSNNNISRNNITVNKVNGVRLRCSSDNSFHQNNFVGNN